VEDDEADADCDRLLPGSYCSNSTGKCTKPRALDVEDYGIRNSYRRGCGGDDNDDLLGVDLLCKRIYKGYRKKVAKYTADPYPIFAELLNEMYNRFWQDSGEDAGALYHCDGSEPDPCPGYYGPEGFEARCVPSLERCEVRPHRIEAVNHYPASVEFVLAWHPTGLTYVVLNEVDLCEVGQDSAVWSEVKTDRFE